MSEARITEMLENRASISKDAWLSTTYADDFIVRGKAFTISKNFTIAVSGVLRILVDYTTFIPAADELGQIFVFPPVFSTTAGPVTVDVYRDTDYTGGTEAVVFNPNTTVQKTLAGLTLTTGNTTQITGSVKGDIVLQYLVGLATPGVSGASGGAATGLSFLISRNTDKTLLEVTNASGAEITFHYGQVFYEI